MIDDPDDEVFDTVASKLLNYGKEIIPNLEQLWEVTVDESVQERIELLIHRVHFQDLQQEFLEWSKAKQPELLRGAILVAKFQFPDLNVPSILSQFDQIRRNIWLELNNYLTPLEQVNVFNSILYNYYKLQGHELTERDPKYFFINQVLESKQGNAYTLGVLYPRPLRSTGHSHIRSRRSPAVHICLYRYAAQLFQPRTRQAYNKYSFMWTR